jgi:hypothetical protein
LTGWDIASSYAYEDSEPFLEEPVLDTGDCFVRDDDVEEIGRTSQTGNPASTLTRSRSQYPDLAMIAPSSVASPLLEFCAPVFEEFSDRTNRRALVDHFCNVLSHLIVFKEDTGNPFRQLVLPMSRAGSPVLNAIFALSSAHLEYRGILNEENSPSFHNQALQGLAMLLDQGKKANQEEVLGAIMLLVYYEVVSIQAAGEGIIVAELPNSLSNEGIPVSSTDISGVL